MLTQGERRNSKPLPIVGDTLGDARPKVCPAVGAEGFPPPVIAGSSFGSDGEV